MCGRGRGIEIALSALYGTRDPDSSRLTNLLIVRCSATDRRRSFNFRSGSLTSAAVPERLAEVVRAEVTPPGQCKAYGVTVSCECLAVS